MAQKQDPERASGFSPAWQPTGDHFLFYCTYQPTQSGLFMTLYPLQ